MKTIISVFVGINLSFGICWLNKITDRSFNASNEHIREDGICHCTEKYRKKSRLFDDSKQNCGISYVFKRSKTKMKKLLLIILLLHTISGYSQYTLKGNIKSYDSKYDIMGCAVIIEPSRDSLYEKQLFIPFNKNLKHLKGTVSKQNGKFNIDDISLRKFNLIISDIQSEKIIIEDVSFENNDTINLDTIYMLKIPTVSGFSNFHKGDLEDKWKRNNVDFKLEYPENGKKLKMKFENEIIIINYQDLINYRKE